MAVNKYIISLFPFTIYPLSCLFEKIANWELKSILDGKDFVTGHVHRKINLWVTNQLLYIIHDSTAFILLDCRSYGLRVLTISPKKSPPSFSVGYNIQLMFSRRRLLTTTGANSADWYMLPWCEGLVWKFILISQKINITQLKLKLSK